MRMLKYLGKRILVFIPLLLGIMLVSFYLIRFLPGSPAETLAGAVASEEMIASLEAQMGLDKPIYQQFIIYVQNVLHGDLGRSWFTNTNVTDEIIKRFPATFEMITLSIILAAILGSALAMGSALRPKGIASKISNVYGFLAGSFADFWFALMLVYLFFAVLHWAPAPMGRISLMVTEPTRITGMYLTDSLLTGNWPAFKSAAQHLALPVLTLGFIHGSEIMETTNITMTELMESDFVFHARMMGVPEKTVIRYAFKNAMTSVITMIGTSYSYLIGGAVLVENVFSWGGLGQYVTSALSNKDYAAIQGFLLVATVFSMIMYLIIDIVSMMIDPRIKY